MKLGTGITSVHFKNLINQRTQHKIILPAILLVIACSAASLPVRADTLVVSGTVGISNTGIDFLPSGTGVGSFTVAAAGFQTGIFVPLALTDGTIKDLGAAVPVGVPTTLSSFLVFASNPNLRFDLTLLAAGGYPSTNCGTVPAVVGQTCTPSGSALNLVNNPGGTSTLTFAVAGNVVNTLTNEVTPFVGTFTSQFTGPYQGATATIGAGGTVTNTFSATFATTPSAVPEPATMLLLGTGLCGVRAAIRKRKKRS